MSFLRVTISGRLPTTSSSSSPEIAAVHLLGKCHIIAAASSQARFTQAGWEGKEECPLNAVASTTLSVFMKRPFKSGLDHSEAQLWP
jgi:hypothetical protein